MFADWDKIELCYRVEGDSIDDLAWSLSKDDSQPC